MSEAEQLIKLIRLWKSLVREHLPSLEQFEVWLNRYDLRHIEYGIERTARFFSDKTRHYSQSDLVKYASGVMASTRRQAAH